jgi:aspartate/methionine/tyrosine aminotransferase
MKEKNPSLGDNISLPVVTSGLTHALSAAAYLFINPGDQVISPDKFWGNYRLVFELSNGTVLDLFEMFDNEELNVNGLREKILSEDEKKVIILNFPNNPTGYSPTRSDANKLIQVLQDGVEDGKKIVVILDDAYFGLCYEDDVYEESLFARLSNLDPNLVAVKVDGSTKEDFAWGLRVGYITIGYKGMSNEAAEALESKAAGFVRSSISSPSNLSQSILIKAMSSDNYKQQKADVYETLKKRYVRVREILDNTPEYKEYFEPLPFNSGYFMCICLKTTSGEEVRNFLREEFNTGVIAIENLLRIAYSSVALSDIEKLFKNIYEAAKKLS